MKYLRLTRQLRAMLTLGLVFVSHGAHGDWTQARCEIYLPPLDDSQGYMGHDEFAVVEQVLVRRFPLYRKGDSNAEPTGGTRQVQYRLVPGEAGWLLQPDRIVDY